MAGGSLPHGTERAEIEAARAALRTLDAEIAVTEARLRSLPGNVRGGGGRASGGRGGSRRSALVPFPSKAMGGATDRAGAKSRHAIKMSEERVRVGVFKAGSGGFQVSRGGINTMLGKAAGPVVGMHIVGAGLHQTMDFGEKQNDLNARLQTRFSSSYHEVENAMFAAGQSFGVEAFDIATSMTGAKGLVSAGARVFASKDAYADAADRWNRAMSDAKLTGPQKRARARLKIELKREAAAQLHEQRGDAAEFIDRWTPGDFMAMDDPSLAALRKDVRKSNVDNLNRIERRELEAARERATAEVDNATS